jgi:hypothetical protein
VVSFFFNVSAFLPDMGSKRIFDDDEIVSIEDVSNENISYVCCSSSDY